MFPAIYVEIDFRKSGIKVGKGKFIFKPLPDKLRQILDMKGLVNFMKAY